jgi:hypothetical protein
MVGEIMYDEKTLEERIRAVCSEVKRQGKLFNIELIHAPLSTSGVGEKQHYKHHILLDPKTDVAVDMTFYHEYPSPSLFPAHVYGLGKTIDLELLTVGSLKGGWYFTPTPTSISTTEFLVCGLNYSSRGAEMPKTLLRGFSQKAFQAQNSSL